MESILVPRRQHDWPEWLVRRMGQWQGRSHRRTLGRSYVFAIYEPWMELDAQRGGKLLQDRNETEHIRAIYLQFASSIAVHFAQLEEIALHSTTTLEWHISASRSLYPAYRISFAPRDVLCRSNTATSERFEIYSNLQTWSAVWRFGRDPLVSKKN
jgi:hypothetical protein